MKLKILNFSKLESEGWTSGEYLIKTENDFIANLLKLTKNLGMPVPSRLGSCMYDILKPNERINVSRPSLSKTFSLGEFPLHTDGAHWLKPPRYIILACFSPGEANRPTLILDAKEIPLTQEQVDLLNCVPLRINTGRNSFFDSIFSNNREFIRYDIGCMKPVCKDGKSALNILSSYNWSEQIKQIQWCIGKVIIFDNWRYLHGRGVAVCEDKNRRLLRILIQ